MSEATMSREDEIREWLEQIPAMGFDPTDAVDYVRYLLAENARLRRENEELRGSVKINVTKIRRGKPMPYDFDEETP